MILLSAYIIETAVWVLATLAITIWVTRVYLNAFLILMLGKAKRNQAKEASAFSETHPPFVTVLLPTFNEDAVADRLLNATTSFNYPNYEVIVADDSTDASSLKRLERWERKGVKIVHRSNRAGFKAGALNNAMRCADPQSEFVAVFDADYLPKPDTIKQLLNRFSEDKTAAVQGYPEPSLNEGKNIITHSVSITSSCYYLVDLVMRQRLDGFVPLCGSAFMIKRKILQQVGGFDETSLTEDWELAARLTEAGYKVVFDQNIRVPAECPSTFRSLVKQQMRWAEGVVRDTRRSLRKMLFSGNPSPLQKFDYVFYGFGSFNGISGSLCWILAFWAFLISERIVQVLGVDRGLILGLGALGKFMLFVAPIYLPLGFVVAVIVGLYKENKLSWAIWCIPGFILSLIITPFIAYSSIRGLIFRRGSWSRTPKTGEITNQ